MGNDASWPKLLWRYILAVSLIFTLITSSHFIDDHVIKLRENDAPLINMSGRQRMLSQRIAYLSSKFITGGRKPEIHADLVSAINLFENSHTEIFKAGNHHWTAQDAHKNLVLVEQAEFQSFDLQLIQTFMNDVRIVTESTDNNAAVMAALERVESIAVGPLLNGLNDIVLVFENRAQKRGASAKAIGTWTFIIALLVLVLEIIFIFIPAHRSITQSLNRLAKSNVALRLARKKAFISKRHADQANNAKSEFLANMSHEIRTPLNGILGMAQLLKMTGLDAKQEKYNDTIMSSGNSLLSIINDVLDISKIEASLMVLEEEECDITEIVQEAADTVTGIAIQKGIDIAVEMDPAIEGKYVTDAKRLKQVLINLAGNAIKFTDEGSVRLKVSSHLKEGLLFQVIDTGPGIAKDHLTQIFERFQQADNSATRKHGGTGLGLTISKDIVTLLGGQIGVESELDQGSTFWFTTPLERITAESADRPVKRPLSTPTVTQENAYKVLYAEDNLINQAMMTETIGMVDNIELVIVENGADAIEKLEAEYFDLVLMDVNMPVMPGDEATKAIRASGASYADIPIIILTANVLTAQKEDYLKAGANAYLPKPVDIMSLLDLIRNFLDDQIANVA